MALPTTMNAVEISAPGGPEVLKPIQTAVPEPKAGEALIKVAAAGVNRPDCLQRAGAYPPPPDASPLPGLEVAGTVAALGQGVAGLTVGDPVCALTPGGGYAEYCTAPAGHCLTPPKGYDMVQAAALPENFFTVWYNVFMRSRLTAGERFLVHGGSSGIGLTAIQLATRFGATVFTTAGSSDKLDVCREVGADRAINYKTEDWAEAIRTDTQGEGIDVILDMVGGSYIDPSLKLLRRDGRYCFIAFLGGAKAEVDFSPILRNRLSVLGSTLRPQTIAEKEAIAGELKEHVWPLLETDKVRPIIHKTFPLADAADAHALMESSTHIGKIMLTV
ncbi:MAG: NAD(P)H-quinone oxidoreductase [Alphaproteobacteria bacterium]|nr:NAD(P)H-quinone oxidoreductase [Alphaproteobacteria bacterium]